MGKPDVKWLTAISLASEYADALPGQDGAGGDEIRKLDVLEELDWREREHAALRAAVERAVARLDEWEECRNGCVSEVADDLRAALKGDGER